MWPVNENRKRPQARPRMQTPSKVVMASDQRDRPTSWTTTGAGVSQLVGLDDGADADLQGQVDDDPPGLALGRALGGPTGDQPRGLEGFAELIAPLPGLQFDHPHLPQPALQVVRGVEGDDLPVVDDGHAVREEVGLLHIVRGQKDGPPLALELQDELAEVPRGLRVEAGRGLIEDEHLRVVQEGAGEGDAPLHAGGIFLDRLVGPLGQLEPLEETVYLLGQAWSGQAVEGPEVLQVLATGEFPVDAPLTRQDRPDAGEDPGGLFLDVEALDEDPPRGRPEQRGEHLDGRRLAGPVRAQQAEDLALGDGEADTVDRDHGLRPGGAVVSPRAPAGEGFEQTPLRLRAELLAQVLNRQCRNGHG